MPNSTTAGATNAGYGKLVPVDRQKHKGLGIKQELCRQFARRLNTVYINIVEFFHAQSYYPIVFTRADNNYVPCIVTGLKAGHNLFSGTDALWDTTSYVPAFVRRYPFITMNVTSDNTDNEQQAMLVDEIALCEDGDALFDMEGQATQAWNEIEIFMADYIAAEKRTALFTDKLDKLGILESFETHIHPKVSDQVRLTGLYRVNEDKLNALSGKVIKKLMQGGELSRIYAHLISLENFAKLLDRSASNQK